jgi:flagellar hook-associated protein 3 FlgL
LSDFNLGLGVRIEAGVDDFQIELGDGSTVIPVNLDGATTVQDVIDAINTAGGGDVTATLAADGNGITLTDNIGGGSDFKVTALNSSFAAQDLGLLKNAGASATLVGDDVATVKSDSVFTHLMNLRDALRSNDERGITLAGEALQADVTKLATERAKVGVRANAISSQIERTQDRQVTTESLLSDVRDADYATAITRLTQLQQQLEANLTVSSSLLNLSLLDFIG